MTVLSSPPWLTISLEISLLALLRNSTQHSSWSRSRTTGSMISYTLCGEERLPPESSASLRDARLPSSNAAAIVTALLGPIPLIAFSLSILISAIPARLPSPLSSSSLAMSITFCPPLPVRSSIASSSTLLNAIAPLASIRSLGISSAHISFSRISLSVGVLVGRSDLLTGRSKVMVQKYV